MNQKYEAFIKVVETGSFKQAAAELGYTQAGISYMMNALEEEMGTALLFRDHAGARLTSDGEALLPWIRDVTNSERALRTRLDEVRHIEGGTVRIASFASVAIHWLPPMIKSFLDLHPRVRFEVECFEEQDELEQATWHGEFDCCFTLMPARLKLHAIPLAEDPLRFVVSRDHPLASEERFPLSAMEEAPTSRCATIR